MSIERGCELGRVSRAGFYRDGQEQPPREAEVAIRDRVQRIALARRKYGYRRVTVELKRAGVAVGESVVRRIMRDDTLLAIKKRKFVVTTKSDPTYSAHPNLAQYAVIRAINQLWVADITYIRLQREYVYLAVVIDVFSRKVVGWSLSRSISAHLSLQALGMALKLRTPGPGLIHHSDQGSQYACNDYVRYLEKHGIIMSMSRAGRPWENAYCESLCKR